MVVLLFLLYIIIVIIIIIIIIIIIFIIIVPFSFILFSKMFLSGKSPTETTATTFVWRNLREKIS